MLTLTYKIPPRSMADDDAPKEKTWKVGDEPLSEQLDDAFLQVVSIVADKEELMYLRVHFSNLPFTIDQCVWRGEMARFIFDNLR